MIHTLDQDEIDRLFADRVIGDDYEFGSIETLVGSAMTAYDVAFTATGLKIDVRVCSMPEMITIIELDGLMWCKSCADGTFVHGRTRRLPTSFTSQLETIALSFLRASKITI